MTNLVSFTCEEDGAIADAEGSLLLLSLFVDLGDVPDVDGVTLQLGGGCGCTFSIVGLSGGSAGLETPVS